MKSYPSITRSTGQDFQEFDAYVFDKLDGRNVRAEWARKTGWYKFGSRTRLFDETDKAFGPAIPMFRERLAEDLEKVARKERWERMIVFMEFWGPTTISGLENADGTYDGTTLTIIDVAPYKQGILGPKQFLDLFRHLNIPKFLGRVRWTRGFVEQVRRAELPGITFEGVVGKAGHGRDHDLVMAKAKTQAWITEVLARLGEEEGNKIVNS